MSDTMKQRSKRYSVVVRKHGQNFNLGAVQYRLNLIENMIYYAFIEHKHDIDPHIHIAIEFDTEITKGKLLKTLTQLFDLDDDCFTIGKTCQNQGWYALNQYLTHKNDPDKENYDIHDIITSDVILYLNLYNKILIREYDDNELLDIVLSARSKTEIIKKIGFSSYAKLSRAIDVIYDEKLRKEITND